MKHHFKYFLLLNLFFASSAFSGPVLDIDFNGNSLLLGSFEGTNTSSQFYSYGNPSGSSANPRYPDTGTLIPLQADALHVFSYLETDTNILSFGFILEKPNGSGGGEFNTTAEWSDPARLSLLDDPGEPGTQKLSDTKYRFDFDWVDCCTDGFVVSGFDQNDMFLNLTNTSGSDLTKVIFLSPDGQSQNLVFNFPTNTFSLSINACDPQTDPNGCIVPTIPEPTVLALMGFGLAGLGFARGRTRRT